MPLCGAQVSEGPTDWRRSPGQGKYARREIELRFVVDGPTPPLVATRLICDRYITGTQLRLRKVTVDVAITNIYLEQSEHELLARLPARP